MGTALPPSDWRSLDPATAESFADLTGDRQWIHTPTACGGVSGGTAIAQAALLLGLTVGLLAEVYSFPWTRRTLQRGYDAIRFPASAPLGSRVRVQATLAKLAETGNGSALLTTRVTLQCDQTRQPVLRGALISLLESKAAVGDGMPSAPQIHD